MRLIKHLTTDWFHYGFETLAVVVGILMAFALDNWNEKRQTQNELSNILDEIREDLVRDTSLISNILTLRIHDFEAQTRVINAIQDDWPLNDQIRSDPAMVMLMRPVPLVKSGFSLLKESRLTSIEDRALRSTLVEYYEQVVVDVEAEYQDNKFEFETVLLPYVRNNLKTWKFGQSATPINWEAVKEDHYFLAAIEINLGNISGSINSLEEGLSSATNLILMLDNR